MTKLGVRDPVSTDAVAGILSACPNVQYWSCLVSYCFFTRPALRCKRRHAFARILNSMELPALRSVHLEVNFETHGNNSVKIPSVSVKDAPIAKDAYSRAWRRFSQRLPNLERAEFDGVGGVSVSPALFWRSPEERGATPHWPELGMIQIRASMAAPDGSWLFDGGGGAGEGDAAKSVPPAHDVTDGAAVDINDNSLVDTASLSSLDSDDWDASVFPTPQEQKEAMVGGNWPINQWRDRQCLAHVPLLFTAAARAVGHMPRLQKLSVTVIHPTNVPCTMSFAVAGRAPIRDEMHQIGCDVEGDAISTTAHHPRTVLWLPEGITVEEHVLEDTWRESFGSDLEFCIKSMIQA